MGTIIINNYSREPDDICMRFAAKIQSGKYSERFMCELAKDWEINVGVRTDDLENGVIARTFTFTDRD